MVRLSSTACSPTASVEKVEGDFDGWQTDENGQQFFWGIDTGNRATLWKKGFSEEEVSAASAGRAAVEQTGGVRYIPIQKGLVRGDPGVSFRTGRPVADTLFLRLRNSLLLAGIAFIVVMPLAVVLGLVAGLNEGKGIDRVLTVGGLLTTASPNFATGILLILVFAAWLEVLPGSVVLLDDKAILDNPVHAGPARGHADPHRAGLCAAHHARQRGRGRQLALCPHGPPEGPAPRTDRQEAHPAQLPDGARSRSSCST